ncbi:DNA-processing protein DprA [Puia dinghuensis]|uniref:DNA processing protein DprA n=1 Tax=Puia dinghuensis TaxID=1792502 RepID=A0A8J2UIS9_9BACT|nr:DNA-processing protein DprA [Puia dinghuensis]GGB22541.1 DNA processing protein DprA [Puia dinghuensis]
METLLEKEIVFPEAETLSSAEETFHRVALTRVDGIGDAYTKKLIARFGDAAAVFRAKQKDLLSSGVDEEKASAILGFRGFAAVEAELLQLEKEGVRVLYHTDQDYPHRLRDIPDSPPLLFYKGNADLNAKKIVAVIGTRSPSDYGRQVTAQLIRQLEQSGILVVSGLALGIDTAAHKAALNHHLPTIGVLGHGFRHLYPPENKTLAKAMLREGGLLTSFAYSDKPDGFRFPDRNRIVAALCDAVLVVETARQGGSLLTVGEALKYGRKVFTVPGRLTDPRSAGCNWLLQQRLADALISGEQLVSTMGWDWPANGVGIQASLPFSSPDDRKKPEDGLLALLQEKDSLSIDELTMQSQLPPSSIALLLVNLELRGLISVLPGKRYRLNQPLMHV